MPDTLTEPQIGELAPNFTLKSHAGETISLEDFRGEKNVIVFFVQTYTCVSCRTHVGHLGTLYPKFQDTDTEVLVVLNGDVNDIQGYADVTQAPFPILADPDHTIYELYGLNKVFLLSTRTASAVVDKSGALSYLKTATNTWGWRQESQNLIQHLETL